MTNKNETNINTLKNRVEEKIRTVEDKAIKKLDKNGDDTFDIKDVLYTALEIPGVKIDRAEFLQKAFADVCDQETIDKAILETPYKAGIDEDTVNKIADDEIEIERNAVAAASTGLGIIPGGAAVAASTSAADIVQYYSFMIRAAQKLMYLYGFPQVEFEKDDEPIDDGTMDLLLLCLGAMNDIEEAKDAIKGFAKQLSKGATKIAIRTAASKGVIGPIVNEIVNYLGIHMSKNMLAGGAAKSLLFVGGVVAGASTFISFKKCCENFKNTVNDTMLSNPNLQTEETND